MIQINDANPKNYEVEKVLFNNGNFSVAIGIWKGKENTLAMRWRGDGKEDKGYPKAFGHPMWFIIDDELKQPIIQSLMLNDKELINYWLNK